MKLGNYAMENAKLFKKSINEIRDTLLTDIPRKLDIRKVSIVSETPSLCVRYHVGTGEITLSFSYHRSFLRPKIAFSGSVKRKNKMEKVIMSKLLNQAKKLDFLDISVKKLEISEKCDLAITQEKKLFECGLIAASLLSLVEGKEARLDLVFEEELPVAKATGKEPQLKEKFQRKLERISAEKTLLRKEEYVLFRHGKDVERHILERELSLSTVKMKVEARSVLDKVDAAADIVSADQYLSELKSSLRPHKAGKPAISPQKGEKKADKKTA